MTLFEEMYKESTELSKFYRFEGLNSYSHFPVGNENMHIPQDSGYIYFSQSMKHHQYYVRKRLKQLIDNLMGHGNSINKKALLDSGNFNEIVRKIENLQITEKIQSIEFSLSPIIKEILENNSHLNIKKEKYDKRIESCDLRQYNGGYGFCDEWLTVYNLLTYFYGCQRITKENILEFIELYRFCLIKQERTLAATNFLLDESCRTIKINEKVYNDFSKYELMNALEIIVEKELYFPESMFSKNPDQSIKKIIQAYNLERERLLELSESIYRRKLNR